MIEFLLGQYKFYSKEEETYLVEHLKDKAAVKAHIELLERRYRRFKRVYTVNTTIIKVVPIIVLAVYLIAPVYALPAFIGGLAAIVLSSVSFLHLTLATGVLVGCSCFDVCAQMKE